MEQASLILFAIISCTKSNCRKCRKGVWPLGVLLLQKEFWSACVLIIPHVFFKRKFERLFQEFLNSPPPPWSACSVVEDALDHLFSRSASSLDLCRPPEETGNLFHKPRSKLSSQLQASEACGGPVLYPIVPRANQMQRSLRGEHTDLRHPP